MSVQQLGYYRAPGRPTSPVIMIRPIKDTPTQPPTTQPPTTQPAHVALPGYSRPRSPMPITAPVAVPPAATKQLANLQYVHLEPAEQKHVCTVYVDYPQHTAAAAAATRGMPARRAQVLMAPPRLQVPPPQPAPVPAYQYVYPVPVPPTYYQTVPMMPRRN